MSKANKPSKVTLPPDESFKTVLDFLTRKFPHVSKQEWSGRILEGSVVWSDQSPVTLNCPYQPLKTVWYYREVRDEPSIPCNEQIIESNDEYLIAYKPHFLPVMPGGQFVNECLQQRLIKTTGNSDLQAVHRLDRDTAGLVLFSVNPETRNLYHQLFSEQKISKFYQAISDTGSSEDITQKEWHIKNYITRSKPSFRFQNVESPSTHKNTQYAESIIRCIQQSGQKALFELKPITGRTHQLRLHMMHIGYPITNDRFYPRLRPKAADNFDQPLQLLASEISFIDPVSKEHKHYSSPSTLKISL